MINIDDEDFDEETLEDKVFEKADFIGEILIGERKIKLALPSGSSKPKPVKPKKPSLFTKIINNYKSSFKKYKDMPLSRLLGLGILLLVAIFCISIVAYLLLLLMTELLKLGIMGFAIFAIFICAMCACGILLIAARYTRK
jgi:hypothetical protein